MLPTRTEASVMVTGAPNLRSESLATQQPGSLVSVQLHEVELP